MTSGPNASYGEARGVVVDIVKSCDLGHRAIELAESGDLDSLKTAEYALLVRPLTAGLSNYLAKIAQGERTEAGSVTELIEKVGGRITEEVLAELEIDPHRTIIDQFARLRADKLDYGPAIYPVNRTIRGAAGFSASAMYIAAVSNAVVIDRAGAREGRPRKEFIDAVKRSHQVALAKPIMHLDWNDSTNTEIVNHGMGVLSGVPSKNDNALHYDIQRGVVVLEKPLELWVDSSSPSGMAVKDSVGQSEDVRIGCPVSFDPSLVKHYYEAVVGMIEENQIWPDPIANDEKKEAIRLASILARSFRT